MFFNVPPLSWQCAPPFFKTLDPPLATPSRALSWLCLRNSVKFWFPLINAYLYFFCQISNNLFELNIGTRWQKPQAIVFWKIKMNCGFSVFVLSQLLDTQDTFPLSYVRFISRSLELSVTYVFTEAGRGLLFERFIVLNMNLIKSIVKCDYYRVSKVVEDTKELGAIDAHKVREFHEYA